ncbi:glycerol-3-phosphate acyltransferase 1, mitochondrial [Epargyreus clarus]|uniref:glycerol-3-phosphate acyltransferase 1, mitochondrial n=1 Tax=Epargyreus clarus TaxID=520877 RepID=UPI003C2E2242
MDTMMNVWTVVEHVRVASGAAELAIFTAILYWFFTSSRVADMLEVVGERVGGWCGRDSSTLRRPVRPRRRYQNDVYAKIDAEITARNAALYRIKDGPVVPAPRPQIRPPAGLACGRCAPLSRESWQDPKSSSSGAVINILDIGRQTFANGGVVSRYLCDLAQCFHLIKYDYKDVVPSVVKDDHFQAAIEETAQEELKKTPNGDAHGGGDGESRYTAIKRKVEARAMKVLMDISSAMSNHVLRLVAWLCHKAVRRVAGGGCGTRAECVERLRRAKAAGLPLVFVPLHRSHFDYILVTFTLYLTGLRPPLVAAGDNMRIPFFGWFLRGCGAFYIRRRVDGSEYHGDPIYKSALRAYILNSLAANNNLEFFIEGGRTRTGKPQPPKAGILSVIMDAYLDGTIDDALLVPVTLNYDKLVDGSFVREQLGMPKQMETFWSALRGIWRTLNTNHGAIRVDFNQPISLKELVTSFQKYKYLKTPIERGLASPNNNLAASLDRQMLCSNSHSSMYGDDVSDDHKVMVEAIGRHLVYDAAQATALMITNVVAYVLLTEQRGGCGARRLLAAVDARGAALRAQGRDLGYAAAPAAPLQHALDMLGRGLVRREGTGDKATIKPHLSVAASLELSYYANAVVAHYAAPAIVATALESIVQHQRKGQAVEQSEQPVVEHEELMQGSLQLCSVLSQEFILCAPCTRLEDLLEDTLAALVTSDVLVPVQKHSTLEEHRWSRRVAESLEDDEEPHRPRVRYRVNDTAHALAERRRLVSTVRPLLEAYSAACRAVRSGPQADVVSAALHTLTDDFAQKRMTYGEAVSTDAIKNCLKLLRQWGALHMYTEGRQRRLRLCPPYDCPERLQALCDTVYRFNMDTPLLH